MVTVVCGVKILFHHKSKISLLSAAVWAGDFQCILLACCWIFCMLAYVGSPSHGVSFGNGKWLWRAFVSIVSMVVGSILGTRMMACAFGSRCLSNVC